MNTTPPSFLIDWLIHAAAFIVLIVISGLNGFAAEGSTPVMALPVYFVLAGLTLARLHEAAPRYETPLILLPATLASLAVGFCLIIEMPQMFWGFMIPRQLPVSLRLAWMQLTLLALHPAVFEYLRRFLASAHVWLANHGYYGFKSVFLMIAAGLILWLLRSQNLSSDGYDWLKYTVFPKHWTLYLREPLGMAILRAASYWGMKLFHWAPHGSIAVTVIVSGLISVWLLARAVPRLIAPPFATPVLLLIVSCCGFTQVFAGNIEIYALLQLGFSLFLYAAARYLSGEWPAWAPGLAFGVMFCVHLSSGWWLPAFLLLPLVKALQTKQSGRPLADAALMHIPALLFVVGFACFVLMHGYGGDVERMRAHFLSDQVMFVGTDAAMFRPLPVFLTSGYYTTMLSEYVYMMPAICLLAIALAAAVRYWTRPDAQQCWLFALAGLYWVYSLVWNPDRPFPSDWDIFSALTIPAGLALGSVAARLRLPRDTVMMLFYQCASASFLYLLMQLIRNHTKVTDWPLFL